MRIAEGRLGVDHSFSFATGFAQGFVAFRTGRRLKGSMELELVGGVGLLETVQEQAAEKAREDARRKEEAAATGDPAATVG